MKLAQKEIQFIDDFLEGQKIKYLDVRSELIDHLATEFEEQSQYVLIEDYLNSKISFIKDFARRHQKTIHWSYQKQLWIKFSEFFYKPKYVLFTLGIIVLGYILLQNISIKNFSFVCFFILAILILYPIYYQIKYSKAVKKVQSMQSLFSVTALPSVFLYLFNIVNEYLIENYVFVLLYLGFSILLGVSAIIIIEKDRSKILEKYYQLVR